MFRRTTPEADQVAAFMRRAASPELKHGPWEVAKFSDQGSDVKTIAHPWDTLAVGIELAPWPRGKLRRFFYSLHLEDGRELFAKLVEFTPEDQGRMPPGLVGFRFADSRQLASFAPFPPDYHPRCKRRTYTPARVALAARRDPRDGARVFYVFLPVPLYLDKLQDAASVLVNPEGFNALGLFFYYEEEAEGQLAGLGAFATLRATLSAGFTYGAAIEETTREVIAKLPHDCRAYRFALIEGGDLDGACIAQAVDTDPAPPEGWKVGSVGHRFNVVRIPKPKKPGRYCVLLRAIDWDPQTRQITAQTCQPYPFEVPQA